MYMCVVCMHGLFTCELCVYLWTEVIRLIFKMNMKCGVYLQMHV